MWKEESYDTMSAKIIFPERKVSGDVKHSSTYSRAGSSPDKGPGSGSYGCIRFSYRLRVRRRSGESVPSPEPGRNPEAGGNHAGESSLRPGHGVFAEMVNRETQGRVTVKIYYNGSLGTPTEIIEQVKFGGIAMARVNVLELSEEVESIRKYFVPSNFAGGDAQTEWIHSNEETLRDECQMDRITPLVWYYPDFRCFYGTDSTFLDKKDLEGKKIESSESALMAEIFRDMGIELAGSVNTNTYKSLISGNIDGAESSFSEFICNNYDQYIHFVTKNDAWCLPDVMIINTENLTSLSKEDREAVEKCAQSTYQYQKQSMEQFHEVWVETLTEEPEVSFSEGAFR